MKDESEKAVCLIHPSSFILHPLLEVPMSLDTLANVKSRLGVTTAADDTLLGLLQNSADQWITNHCDRDFAGGTFTEYLPGGSEFVQLRNYPVTAVTSVKVDPAYAFGSDTVVSPTAYVVH